jgi:dephospho-CoA kinase
MQRSQLTTETIASIMAAQCTRDQRLAAADDVIVNDRDLAYLRQQVAALHQKYLDLKSHAL